MAEEKIEGLDDLLDDNIGTYHVREVDAYLLRPVKDMGERPAMSNGPPSTKPNRTTSSNPGT